MARPHVLRGREADISRMWRDGKTSAEIAAHFGVSHQAILYHVKDLGKGGSAIRMQERVKDTIRLFSDGKSIAEIAIAIGIHPSRVVAYLLDAGISTKRTAR